MRRPVLVNGSLLALIVILGGLTWLSIQEQEADHIILLTQLNPDQVNRITLDNQTGQAIRLEHTDRGWQMLHPYEAKADDNRIQRLLEIVRSSSFSHFQAPADVAEYGLAPPSGLQFGVQFHAGWSLLLRLKSQIHLIKDRFIHHLQARAEDFISPALLPAGSRIRAIHTPEWQLSFISSGKGSLDPPNTDISGDDLNKKRDQWQLARASRVVPAPEGKGSGRIEIKLEHKQQPISFELGRSEQYTLLIRRDLGLAYAIPKKSKFLQPPENTSRK